MLSQDHLLHLMKEVFQKHFYGCLHYRYCFLSLVQFLIRDLKLSEANLAQNFFFRLLEEEMQPGVE
jgi:hypothetical protein